MAKIYSVQRASHYSMLLLVQLRFKDCGNWKLDKLRLVKVVLDKHLDCFEPLCIQN